MAATVEMVARLRRMVAEPTDATYKDEDLAQAIENHPLVDARGEAPLVEGGELIGGTAGVLEENPYWEATYDLNAAAADIWEEKAAALVGDYDFRAGDNQFNRSQAHLQAMRQARHFRSRRSPGTYQLRPEPKKVEPPGNL